MGDFSPLNGRYWRFLKILFHAFVDTYCIMQWRNFQRVREGSSDPGGIAVCGLAQLTLAWLNSLVCAKISQDVRDVGIC